MADDIVIRFSVKDDGSPFIERINQKLKGTKEVSRALVPGLEKARTSLTGFVSANATLIGVLVGVGAAMYKVIKSTVDYNNSVHQVALTAGTTHEEASRLIQVLDDYKISVEDVTAASRALKNNGLVPTTETLALLAGRYQAIRDPAEKMKFVQDNLGRGGAKWLEVLNKTPAALRAQAAGINSNLIVSERMYQESRKLEIAQDNLSDSWKGASTTLGNFFIPLLTLELNGFQILTQGIAISIDKHISLYDAMQQVADAIVEQQNAMLKDAEAQAGAAESTDALAESQRAAEDAAQKLSGIYTGLLSSMFTIQSANANYTQTMDDLIAKDAELAAEKDRLTLAMWEEQAAGKMTNEENLRYVQQMDEITQAQEDNAKAKDQADEDAKKAAEQRVYDLAQQKLAADGVIDSGEYEYLQRLAVQMGLVSLASANQAIEENKRADALVASFAQTQPTMEQTLATMQDIAGYNGTSVDFGVNFSTTGSVPGLPPTDVRTSGGGARGRDSGGAGVAGQAYMIGTGAQPEVFVPNTNGAFIPNAGGMGATYNITINNPKKETAENSIRQALKKLSYVRAAG